MLSTPPQPTDNFRPTSRPAEIGDWPPMASAVTTMSPCLCPFAVRYAIAAISVFPRLEFRAAVPQLAKDGVNPFAHARLCLASAGYQIEGAAGRFCGLPQKGSRPGGGKKPNLEGESYQSRPAEAPTDALSPSPKLGGSGAPYVWAAQFFSFAPDWVEHAHGEGARRPL
jgi:hypothetical protein